MTFVSFAQNFEDVILWRALSDVPRGRYVDVGAHDPVVDSVSYAFYQLGWRGMHVEPIPAFAAKLREARPEEFVVEAAVTDEPGPIPFYELGGLSTGCPEVAECHARMGHGAREILVPTVRLDDLLKAIGAEVHWLKIDVEGMEADVLRSWGDSPDRPWILVIESTFPNSTAPTQHLWIDEVLRRGYREVLFDGLSRYFLHEDHFERSPAFEAPANVFDGFAVTRHHFVASSLRGEIDQGHQRICEAQASLSDIREHLAESEQRLEALRSEHASALRDVAKAEQEHRAALDTLSWERRDSERQLREQASVAEADAAAARVELARLDERCTQLRDKLDRADAVVLDAKARLSTSEQELETSRLRNMEITEERDRARVQLDRSRAETERMGRDFEEEVEKLRTRLTRADFLIGRAAAEEVGLWHRIGEALGVARPRAALQMLRTWRDPNSEESLRGVPGQQDSAEGKVRRMPSLAPEKTRNPYLRANSLAELLAWHDLDFIRCAYVTVLGRQPDRQGESYYVGRIRRGHSKMEVLWDLRHCAEAAAHDPGISGFDRALRRSRVFVRPVRVLWRSILGLRSEARLLDAEQPGEPAENGEIENLKVKERHQNGAGVDALAAEIETLKTIIDGFAHALRGVTNAQARYEKQIEAITSTIASSSAPKAPSRVTSPSGARSGASKSSVSADLIETVR